MADVLTSTQRSRCMSRIRSKDTKPELLLRRALWAGGHRYRTNYKLTGRPDLVFVRSKLAVFVDGCFWHGCPEHYQAPKTSADFWRDKIRKNILRDVEVTEQLQSEGWRVLRFWEHETRTDTEECVARVCECVNRAD